MPEIVKETRNADGADATREPGSLPGGGNRSIGMPLHGTAILYGSGPDLACGGRSAGLKRVLSDRIHHVPVPKRLDGEEAKVKASGTWN